MISRKLWWFIALAFAGLLAVAHWAGRYPARVVLINQGSTLRGVKIATAGDRFDIGTLQSGETRVVRIESGDYVTVEFEASGHRRWRSPERIAPAQSLILDLRDGRVEVQRRALR
ncbi:MAG TPA: hypothetical protein VF980_07140 [Thermoanaerobaculia bacterium]